MPSFLSKLTAGGSAQWEELVDPSPSPTFYANRTSASITRTFRVAQSDFAAFDGECFSSGGIPGRHPTNTFMFVQTVSGEPMPGFNVVSAGSGHQEPDFWKLTVTYAPLESEGTGPYDPPPPYGPLDVIVANASFTLETMTLPGYGGLKWYGTGDPIIEQEVEPYLVIPVAQWSLQIPRVRSIPWEQMRKCRGRVNKSVFNGAEPETVLYTGMNVSIRYAPTTGERQYDIEHHFSEKAIQWSKITYGWNHFYNAKTKEFDKIINDADEPMYELTDEFASLL